jgi:nucleotide-binding universal stress UspA family protein
MTLDEILVPVDFSDDAAAALDRAIELAQHFGARIHLLHAYESLSATASAYGGGIPVDLGERIREAAAVRLEEWRARGAGKGVEIDVHLSSSLPSQAILDTAREVGADMIVMGTRGISGLMHVLVGSVAERTVRHATCPVLTVKQPA